MLLEKVVVKEPLDYYLTWASLLIIQQGQVLGSSSCKMWDVICMMCDRLSP
jgi:hypothetical protein